MEKQFDVICMGRVAVDLYSQQIGARLEDVSSFAKYLGGSSGNVAYGTARQGLRSSMLARVGDEHMGRFLREELNQVGCDTSHLITDKERLTALVLLGIKDRDTFPLIFYRDNCADMAITASDVDESYIASARCIAITGTHLSHPQTREAVLTALNYARRHGVRTVLDANGDALLEGVRGCPDLLKPNERELESLTGSSDPASAWALIERGVGRVLVSMGARGCCMVGGEAACPPEILPLTHLARAEVYAPAPRVACVNPVGSGDSFLAGYLYAALRGLSDEHALRLACAAGAANAAAFPAARIVWTDILPLLGGAL